jgi:hypothetical protein
MVRSPPLRLGAVRGFRFEKIKNSQGQSDPVLKDAGGAFGRRPLIGAPDHATAPDSDPRGLESAWSSQSRIKNVVVVLSNGCRLRILLADCVRNVLRRNAQRSHFVWLQPDAHPTPETHLIASTRLMSA